MPALTSTILLAQIKATLLRTRGGRALAFRCPDGWDGPSHLDAEDKAFQVRECRSDLEAREALASVPAGELVLLVRAQEGTLAEDTIARVAKGRLLDLNHRETLLHLTGAQAIDPRLLLHKEVVTLLVQRWHPEARLTTTANIIDCGRVFAFLLGRPSLALEAPDLLGLLLWSLEDGMASVLNAPVSLRAAFFDWVHERSGSALNLIEGALKENGHRLVSLGLLLGLLFPANGPVPEEARNARIRLERFLGDVVVGATAAQTWYRAAKSVVTNTGERQQRELMRELDQWLDELRAGELAENSDFSPRGFDLRLDSLAAALQTARRSESGKAWDALLAAGERVASHGLAKLEGPRMENIQMALRLTRWLRGAVPPAPTHELGELSSLFLKDSAFVDWARQRLRHGDGREALNKAYKTLLSKVDEKREEINAGFARSLHHWFASGAKDDGVIPIEDTITQVIEPLAKEARVLLLVMDGMSGAVFSELMTDLMQCGWHSLSSAGHRLPKPVIAALPCVTQVSRAALFRGRLDASDTTGEAVNFREHPLLHRNIQSKAKPQLFLKANLADSGGAGLSSEVREAISGQDSKVVGVVINAVDDQLSTMGQLALQWTVKQIKWLKDLLDAAAIGQRVVVLMSDHGHVPDKESGRSLQIGNAVGDRHRTGPPTPGEGEMAFSGQRLLAATGIPEWIFSMREGLRYGSRKSGYHGGVADQEMIVPLAILSASADDMGSFHAADFPPPAWWSLEAGAGDSNVSATPVGSIPSTRKKKPAVAEPNPLELWAATGAPDPVSPVTKPALVPSGTPPSWMAALLASDIMRQQRGHAHRSTVTDDQISRCLSLMESKGGVIPVNILAREMDLPSFRVGGFVAQLQRLLNVEGYLVLESDASQSLRLNREMLFKQFDIKP